MPRLDLGVIWHKDYCNQRSGSMWFPRMSVGSCHARMFLFLQRSADNPVVLIKMTQAAGIMLENISIVKEFAHSVLIIGARPIGREH